jgi:hypothetical protein
VTVDHIIAGKTELSKDAVTYAFGASPSSAPFVM